MKSRLSFLTGRTRQREEKSTSPACPGHNVRGTLTIDCRECKGEADLTSSRCLRRVIRTMASEAPGLTEVTLSRDWQVSYGSTCTEALNGWADVIRFCDGLNHHLPFEDCSSCRTNPMARMTRVVECLPSMAADMEHRNLASAGGHGRACEQCATTLRSNLDHVRSLVDRADALANRSAYRVVISHDD